MKTPVIISLVLAFANTILLRFLDEETNTLRDIFSWAQLPLLLAYVVILFCVFIGVYILSKRITRLLHR